MALTLTSTPEPITVLTYAGQHWNLRVMNDDQLKWLQGKFMEQVNNSSRKYLTAIKAEMDRRVPTPAKLKIIELVKTNSLLLAEHFQDVLTQDVLVVSDLITVNLKGQPTANRLEEGFELALSGRWELPDASGRAFLVDSFTSHGSLKYQVKSKNSKFHNFNLCSCDDFTYKAAGKLRGWCKHVIAVWLLVEVQKL